MATGRSKNIRISKRSDADVFLAKDFLEMGGTQNATSYKEDQYLNMSGPFEGSYSGLAQNSYANVNASPGNTNVLICTNPWNDGSVNIGTQIESYVAPSGGGIIDDVYTNLYNSYRGTFVCLGTPSDVVVTPQLTWWWSSMIILDRIGTSGGQDTAQYGFRQGLTNSSEVNMQAGSCAWAPGNLVALGIANGAGTNAIPGSCGQG